MTKPLTYNEQKTWNAMKDLDPPIDFRECGHISGAVQRYFENGIPPGSFTIALLEGNLYSAINKADHNSFVEFAEWARWIQWNLPVDCFGSKEKVQDWINQGGFPEDSTYWPGSNSNRTRTVR